MIFAGTSYLVSLLNRRDAHRARATELSRSLREPLLTTTWVLFEVADGLAHPAKCACRRDSLSAGCTG
jgi:predicted nucleic acid-binding protein